MKKSAKINFSFILGIAVIVIFIAITSGYSLAADKEEAGTGENLVNSKSSWRGALSTGDLNHTSSCINSGAALKGSYNNNPCDLTVIYPDYNTDPPGGTKLTDELEDWWVNELVPTLRQITAQMSGFIYTQTQMMAITFDAIAFNEYSRAKQQEEYAVRKRYAPNEYSCVAASNISALSKARTVTEYMTESLKTEMEKRNLGAEIEEGGVSVTQDIKRRWDSYCTYFKDPDTNRGISGCENPEEPGTLPNADINIEGFLFQDTIDMSRADVREAIRNIFINLHQHKIPEKDFASNINSQNIISKENASALRNSAAHVIASIIARRTPVSYETISGVTSGDLIKQIRINAGIQEGDDSDEFPSEISANPSYNELMLALTKERFLDPTYYIRVQSNIAAIEREQASVEGYVNMQLSDIYQLQEQINTLLAAKASLTIRENASQATAVESMSTGSAQ